MNQRDYRPVTWFDVDGGRHQLPACDITGVEIRPNGEVVVRARVGAYGGIPRNQYEPIMNQLNRPMPSMSPNPSQRDYRLVTWFDVDGGRHQLPACDITGVEIKPSGEVVVRARVGAYGGIPRNQYEPIMNQLNRPRY